MSSARFHSEFFVVFQSTSALAPIDVHKFSHSRIVPIISHPNPPGYFDDDSSIDIVVSRIMVRAQRKSKSEKGTSEKMRDREKL
jgi:hypothetical protein